MACYHATAAERWGTLCKLRNIEERVHILLDQFQHLQYEKFKMIIHAPLLNLFSTLWGSRSFGYEDDTVPMIVQA